MPATGTGSDPVKKILIWVNEQTWQAAVDAARELAPEPATITLLHVTAQEPPDVAQAAYLGLLGRGRSGQELRAQLADSAATSAAELLDAAAERLRLPREQISRTGRTEREVVAAAAGADLLIMARDGDRPGSARGAWAGRPGSPSTTRPARSCWSGRRERHRWTRCRRHPGRAKSHRHRRHRRRAVGRRLNRRWRGRRRRRGRSRRWWPGTSPTAGPRRPWRPARVGDVPAERRPVGPRRPRTSSKPGMLLAAIVRSGPAETRLTRTFSRPRSRAR